MGKPEVTWLRRQRGRALQVCGRGPPGLKRVPSQGKDPKEDWAHSPWERLALLMGFRDRGLGHVSRQHHLATVLFSQKLQLDSRKSHQGPVEAVRFSERVRGRSGDGDHTRTFWSKLSGVR